MSPYRLTVVIHKEEDTYVAHCPQLDLASQGETRELARANIQEAIELFLETADPAEIDDLLGHVEDQDAK